MKHIKPSSPILALFLVLVASSFLVATLASAEAAKGQWEITADKITRYEDPPVVIAEGHVVLEKKESVTRPKDTRSSQWSGLLGEEKGGRVEGAPAETVTEMKTLTTVKADWAAYDVNLGKIKARGNLLIDNGTDQLTAESGSIDMQGEVGMFDNAVIVGPYMDMHLEGRVVEKTGDLTYHIEDGWIVTCKLQQGETPPWSFGAADVEITDGGYAYLKHATFRIKDVPILYSPIMLLPAKRKRQTGFLFPSIFTSSRDGFSIETPFFIDLSPNTDITLFPRYLANRGMMNGAEFRYVLDENSKGMLMGNYLADTLTNFSDDSYYKDSHFTHTNSDRYWLRGKADQNIGQWITRLDLDVASDRDYLQEFNSGSTGFTTSNEKFSGIFGRGFVDKANQYRDNTFAFLRSWDNGTSLEGEFFAVNDLSQQVYTADNPSRVWKLPSLTYSGLLPLYKTGGPDVSWDANYTNFWREQGVGAQRIDLVPTVTTGVPISPYVEASISGGVRDTLYMIQGNGASDWGDSDSKNRYIYNLGGEIGTTLMHDFTANIGDVKAWSHTVRPYVAYSYTSMPKDVLLPQFDSIDALREQNIVYYGVNNFFDISGEHNGREYERTYAFLKVKQGYDLLNKEPDSPLSTFETPTSFFGDIPPLIPGSGPLTPVEIKTGFYPLELLRLMYTTDIDMYGKGAYLHSIEADYASGRGDLFALDYRYNSLTNVDSVSGSVWHLLPYNFAAGYSLQRAIATSETIEEKIRLRYHQPCWSVELSSNSTVGVQTYMITFSLANIGNGFNVPGL